MKDNTNIIAKKSPKYIWKSPLFWLDHQIFIAITILAILIGLVLSPYTYPVDNLLVAYITLGVHLMFFLSLIYISYSILSKVYVENTISNYVLSKVNNYRDQTKGNPLAKKINIEEMDNTFLPDNSSANKLPVLDMFQRICNEAKEHKIDESVNIISIYQYDYLKNIDNLKSIQKLSLWMGILGTFIGIIISIKEVPNILSPSNSGIEQESVTRMFEGLTLSFGTSIAGIEIAVLCGLLIIYIQNILSEYFTNMEEAARILLDTAYLMEFDSNNTIHTLKNVSDTVNNATKQLLLHKDEVKHGLQSVYKKIEDQTSHIQGGIVSIGEVGSNFNEFLKEIDDSQAEVSTNIKNQSNQLLRLFSHSFADLRKTQKLFISELRSIYDPSSISSLRSTLKQSTTAKADELIHSVDNYLGNIDGKVASLNKIFDRLLIQVENTAPLLDNFEGRVKTHFSDSSSNMSSNIDEAINSFHKTVSSLKESIESFDASSKHSLKVQGDMLHSEIKHLSKLSKSQDGMFAENTRSLAQVTRSLQSIEKNSKPNYLLELFLFTAKSIVITFVIYTLFYFNKDVISHVVSSAIDGTSSFNSYTKSDVKDVENNTLTNANSNIDSE